MAQPHGHSPMHPTKAEGGMWQQDTDGDFAENLNMDTPPDVRNGFIRKVYAILSVQLAVTFGIALYMNTQLTTDWVARNASLYYVASFGTLGLTLGVSCCCASAMRTFPFNYLVLGAITVGMATIVGFTTVIYTTDSVLLALATTTAVFLLLTAYACLTKTDFTGMGPYLFAGLMALSMFGFMMMLWGFITGAPLVGTTIHKVYACGGVLLFVLYIIYDTQLIVGGRHKKHQFTIDDYAFAALNLYLDIVNLFMFLLSLMGERRE